MSPPALAEVGEEGTQLWAHLEVKLAADVSIIGEPRVHKVSTIVTLTHGDQRAHPK